MSWLEKNPWILHNTEWDEDLRWHLSPSLTKEGVVLSDTHILSISISRPLQAYPIKLRFNRHYLLYFTLSRKKFCRAQIGAYEKGNNATACNVTIEHTITVSVVDLCILGRQKDCRTNITLVLHIQQKLTINLTQIHIKTSESFVRYLSISTLPLHLENGTYCKKSQTVNPCSSGLNQYHKLTVAGS